MTTLLRHRVAVIFCFASALSVAALVVLWIYQDAVLPLVLVSLAFNFWIVFRSERHGFVRGRELRRAYEPPRRFNEVQSLVLIVLALAEFSIGTYVLIG